jgi:hypothetical protein
MSEPKRHIYESTTLGMPALKMVLVHARNEAQNAAATTHVAPVGAEPEEDPQTEKVRVVRRIIERLEELD